MQVWATLKKSWVFWYGIVLVLYFSLTITGKELTYFPGDLGDARFNTYVLEHAHQFFTGQIASFWDAPFMYPEEEVITFSDNLLGAAPIYSAFRLLHFDRETAFQLWMITLFLLNFICCYFFLKWVFNNKYAAVLGAFVFTFSIAFQSQLAHAQVFPRFPIPMAFWLALLFLKDLKPIYFFGMAFSVVYQFYCGIYLGFFLAIPIGSIGVVTFIYKRNEIIEKIKDKNWLFFMLVSLVLNIGALYFLLNPYTERAKLVVANTYEYILPTLPTLRSYFYAPKGSLIWSFLDETASKYPAFWDHSIFAGGIATISLIGFVLVVLIKMIDKNKLKSVALSPAVYMLIIATGITFLIFSRYQGFSFYQFFFPLPGFSAIRSLTRIINIELLFFAFATAFMMAILFEKHKKIALPLFLFCSVMLLVDNYRDVAYSSRTNKLEAQTRINNLVKKMEKTPPNYVVSYEPDTILARTFVYQIDAMLASQELHLTTINGYSATAPYGFDTFWREINETSRKKWLKIRKLSSDSVFVVH